MRTAYLKILYAGVLSLLALPVFAAEDAADFYLSVGMEYTTGTYGGDADVEDFYVPLGATLDYGNFAFRLTVPYLRLTAPEGTSIVGPGGEPIPGTGDIVTTSGLGDVVAGVTFYDVVRSERHRFVVDVKGKVKFGTADADKGLGTGEADFSVMADFLKILDNATLLASVGYKFRGDPAEYDLEDTVLASAGVTFKMSPELRSGVMLDYREASFVENDSIVELTGFISRRMSDDWRVLFYVLAGSGDNAPDWGAGIQVKRSMADR